MLKWRGGFWTVWSDTNFLLFYGEKSSGDYRRDAFNRWLSGSFVKGKKRSPFLNRRNIGLSRFFLRKTVHHRSGPISTLIVTRSMTSWISPLKFPPIK